MRSLLNRFFAYYRPHRGLFLLDFSCAVASGLLELGFPIAVKLFIDTLLPTGEWGLIVAGLGRCCSRSTSSMPASWRS